MANDKIKLSNRLAKSLLGMLPRYNNSLYRLCKKYVDGYRGDNDTDFRSNGELAYLRQELGGGQALIVFDVGSNIGEWARAALAINGNIFLHCFEPSSETFALLENNKFPPNVTLNRAGLGSMPGEMELHIAGSGSPMNSLYMRHGVFGAEMTRTEKVSIETVDKYCTANKIDHINFIKVDVEGHELAVFQGMRQKLEQGKVKCIQFEYGGCNLDARVYLGDIWEFFSRFDYSFYKVYPQGLKSVLTYTPELETFQYSNWVVMHNDHSLKVK